MSRIAEIPLSNAPLGLHHPRAAVRRRRLVLKRSRDSEARAERNEMPCTKPMDSVHNVTIKLSIIENISFCVCRVQSREDVLAVATPETPCLAKMTMLPMMHEQLKILEHATATRAYLRLLRPRS
jgi:hypothetical protein